MQSVSSRIWTSVAVSISYDDNDYTTVSDSGEGYEYQAKTFHLSFLVLICLFIYSIFIYWSIFKGLPKLMCVQKAYASYDLSHTMYVCMYDSNKQSEGFKRLKRKKNERLANGFRSSLNRAKPRIITNKWKEKELWEIYWMEKKYFALETISK